MTDGGFVWLASYPKSGNTWVRVFLANYLANADVPVDINKLQESPIASARAVFDDVVGVNASDLTFEEIAERRPQVYRWLAATSGRRRYVKVHDAQVRSAHGWLFPPEVTAGAIYVLRNPLDVAVSFAEHTGAPIDVAVDRMNRGHSLAADPTALHDQLAQELLSWSAHVLSWVDNPAIRVTAIRYEDLYDSPHQTFAQVVSACGLDVDVNRVARAVEFSSFAEMQRQEDAHGFRERSALASRFFSRGRPGAWRQHLSDEQVRAIRWAHAAVMGRWAY